MIRNHKTKGKTKMPKLLRVLRTPDRVVYRQEFAGNELHYAGTKPGDPSRSIQGTEERETTAHEAPLKAFDAALQALGPVAISVLEITPTYRKGMEVIGVEFSYTKQGIRSAAILFVKNLAINDGAAHKFKTPMFQFDDGKTPEEGRRACTKGQADALCEVIKQTERYANGDRQQKLLKFEAAPETDPEDEKQGQLIPVGKGG